MQPRRLVPLVAVLGGIAFLAARCDRRSPGQASAVDPPLQLESGGTRTDVRFPCGDAVCAAWLYLPREGAGRPPVVVMGHGFAGTRDVGLAGTAERLAAAGLAALVFDYRHFGASGGWPRQIVDPSRQLEDWRAAVAFVRGDARLAGDRVALLGSSLGGGHALIVASQDPGIAAVAAQAPLIDTSLEGEATSYGAAWAARLLLTGWADFVASALGLGPIEIPAIAGTGGFGMIADDHADAAFRKLVPSGSPYRNAVAARSIFLFDDYDPSAHVATIAAPVLLVASRADRFAPFAAVRSYAEGWPNVTLEEFPGDHFDVYSPPAAEAASGAAVRFLARHLQPAPPIPPS